jgi:hypothetical protein
MGLDRAIINTQSHGSYSLNWRVTMWYNRQQSYYLASSLDCGPSAAGVP